MDRNVREKMQFVVFRIDKKRKRRSRNQYKNKRLIKEVQGRKFSCAIKEFLKPSSRPEDPLMFPHLIRW